MVTRGQVASQSPSLRITGGEPQVPFDATGFRNAALVSVPGNSADGDTTGAMTVKRPHTANTRVRGLMAGCVPVDAASNKLACHQSSVKPSSFLLSQVKDLENLRRLDCASHRRTHLNLPLPLAQTKPKCEGLTSYAISCMCLNESSGCLRFCVARSNGWIDQCPWHSPVKVCFSMAPWLVAVTLLWTLQSLQPGLATTESCLPVNSQPIQEQNLPKQVVIRSK